MVQLKGANCTWKSVVGNLKRRGYMRLGRRRRRRRSRRHMWRDWVRMANWLSITVRPRLPARSSKTKGCCRFTIIFGLGLGIVALRSSLDLDLELSLYNHLWTWTWNCRFTFISFFGLGSKEKSGCQNMEKGTEPKDTVSLQLITQSVAFNYSSCCNKLHKLL